MIILLVCVPMAALACDSMNYTDCNGVTTIEASSGGMDLRINGFWQQDKVNLRFSQGSSNLEITIGPLSSVSSMVYQVTYKKQGQDTSAAVSAVTLADGDYSALTPLFLAIDSSFLFSARDISLSLPDSTPRLAGLKRLSLAALGSILAAKNKPHPYPNIASIFYASCYWACVIGSGEWLWCGDYCYEKYGTN